MSDVTPAYECAPYRAAGPCLSCDGRNGDHTPDCYFAPHEESDYV